jgi:acid phosphatase (class A)
MRRQVLIALCFYSAAAIVVASTATGEESATKSFYVAPQSVVLTKLLPPPPASNSEAQARDMSAVLEVQRTRTAEAIRRAEADNVLSIFVYNDVLGPNFRPEKLPLTTEFFKKAQGDARAILLVTKHVWNRPRPHLVNSEVIPLGGKLRAAAAYPSGTTVFGTVTAIILANMVPEKSAEIFARGEEFAANRLVLGVHYPTDLVAGRLAGTVIASVLFQSPRFNTDLEVAQSELRSVLGYDERPLVAKLPTDDSTATGSVRTPTR